MSTGIRLSKSQLDKFEDCARCFWLAQRHKLKQPDMISSKVWKGVERVAIQHYEEHRRDKTTPCNLLGQVPEGAIPYQADRIDMKALRYWGKGLPFVIEGVTVTTALDDMLQYEAGGKKFYAVIDYKSKSKATDAEATAKLYKNQANVFDLAANLNDYPTAGVVFFDYWYPISVTGSSSKKPDLEGDHGITLQQWGSQVVSLIADHNGVRTLVKRAAACLDSAMPDPAKDEDGDISCTVCAYLHDRTELFKSLKQPQTA